VPAQQFVVQLPNEPGALAALLEALAARGLDLRSIGASGIGAHGAAVLDLLDRVYATYQAAGIDAALDLFGAAVGMPGPPSGAAAAGLPQHLLDMQARIRQNQPFFEHEMRQYPRVVPDLAALQRVARRLVLAVGCESRGLFPYLPNMVLAERLGLNVVEFPGGHIGYATYPTAFAEQLAEVLELAGGNVDEG
jgi:acetyltransferase/esterase